MSKSLNIVITSDHAGLDMRAAICAYLRKEGHAVIDQGPQPGEVVDYPEYAEAAVQAMLCDIPSDVDDSIKIDLVILICGTGIGMSIVANKFSGVSAALVHDHLTAKFAKEHNNANVLCLGSRVTADVVAVDCVATFLEAKFEERHQRRIDMIMDIEVNGSCIGSLMSD